MKQPKKTVQRRDLTVEKIVDATLAVLKSHEPSALTMRRVAEHCGVSAMAIYHHVDHKDQLATLAVDRIFGDAVDTPLQGADWRAQLVELLVTLRAGLLETPGAGMIFVRQAVIGPGVAKVTEKMFQLLHDGGLDGQAIAETADAITMLTIGSIANELTRPARIREQLGKQIAADAAPLLHENMGIYANRDGAERYVLALRWLLAGVVQPDAPAG